MTIHLKQFGTTLLSRQAGREAYLAFSPTLESVAEKETVLVDFDGVETFSPSWGAEFLGPMATRFPGRLALKKSTNLSVILSLETIEESHGYQFTLVD